MVPLGTEHLEDAAALVTIGYRAERERVPSLPSRYEDVTSILSPLNNLARQSPGVAAIRDGRLVGFLLGQILPMFKGRRGVYCPEWAHAAVGEDRREIYENMYAHLSARWVANGCFNHAITILAHDREAADACHWLGFGMMAVDAMRDLTPVQGTIADVEIRRAGLDDVEVAMIFSQALERHLTAAPTFLAVVEKHGRTYYEQWLANPAHALWLACRRHETVACMGLEPSNPTAAYIIRDEKTASITSAFTEADVRGRGIGAALLSHSLGWARSVGYERCAVDFEPQNIPGARFWLRHFQPICYSLIRCLDERVAWAYEKRENKDLW